MATSLNFENIWFDDDILELKVTVDDGKSKFSCNVYSDYKKLDSIVKELNVFKTHIYGGIFDIEFGAFGPEYANGAFNARLHFHERGRIYISIRIQSSFFHFGKKNVASEATLYLISEPALLDTFINQLSVINEELGNIAVLECIISP